MNTHEYAAFDIFDGIIIWYQMEIFFLSYFIEEPDVMQINLN